MSQYELTQIHNIQEYEVYWSSVRQDPDKHHMYEPEIEWNITTIEEAQNEDIRKIFHSNVIILDEFIKWKDKYVWDCSTCEPPSHLVYNIIKDDPHVYVLKGVQITNEDFYWILKRNNKTKYLTCCAAIKPIN